MRIVKILFAVLLLALTSCSGAETISEDIFENVTQEQVNDSIPVIRRNVLIIGNSASRDAFSYVPFLYQEAGEVFQLNMVILYKGSESLSGHYNRITSNNSTYTVDYCHTATDSAWKTYENRPASEVLPALNWNLIILQDTWTASKVYDTVSNNIHRIKTYIADSIGVFPIAYMIVPPNPKAIIEEDLDTQWSQFATVAKNLLENGEVDYVIPCGTAIQNALHTSLKNLGDYNYLSYEGKHLQEGLPCLIEAYTATQSLFRFWGMDISIENSSLCITQEWVYNKSIPGRHGKVITGGEEDYELCKRCALAAVADPYLVTLFE